MHYIKGKHKNLRAYLFTNWVSLREYAKGHKIDLLLVNGEIALEKDILIPIRQICRLWDGIGKVEDGGYPVIFKYQSADVIVKEFLSVLTSDEKEVPQRETGSIQFISIYATDHKKQQTMAAYLIACEYAKSHKVLYINLHGNSVLSKILSIKNENHLSQVIYYLKQKHPHLQLKLKELIQQTEGLSILYGISFEPDIYELTEEDIKLWMEELRLWKEYEIILFDVGNLTKAMAVLLLNSDEVVCLQREEEIERWELEAFCHQLSYAGYDGIRKRIRTITVQKEIDIHKGYQ